ncbi:hypothetical protein L1887_11527 [Cichorium endivia]|nr:hypothetical protein L1887_11527 [Cichorium endivia]
MDTGATSHMTNNPVNFTSNGGGDANENTPGMGYQIIKLNVCKHAQRSLKSLSSFQLASSMSDSGNRYEG